VSWREYYPFQPKYFDRGGGIKMHFVDNNEGEPIVFVHGNPWWSFCYRTLMASLGEEYRVVAFDHVGMGLSSKPAEPDYRFTLESRVDDMERLLDHLKLDRVTLVLHDWGGMIGGTWAARHPERVSRLVVFNTAAFLPSGYSFPWQLKLARSFLGTVLVRGLNAFVWGGVATCFSRREPASWEREGYSFPSKDMNNRLAVHRFVQDIPLKPSDAAYQLCRWTGDNLNKLIDRPMQIVWGGKDFVFTKPFFDEWTRRFPKAETHYLADAGHLVFDDAGREVVPLVRNFLEKHPLPAAR
jgi:cis-3-alkyl-4-acyloxetan-2-one decarboxylase